jgi:protein-glutamine gamma-glutamyltransferase
MNAPRGLAGAALALWGWSIGHPALGFALAVALEALRLIAFTAPVLSTARLALLVRLDIVITLATLGYVSATQNFPHALYTWLRWLPLLLLPLPVAQCLAGGSMPRVALAAALRPKTANLHDTRTIDTLHAWTAATLVAAATGTGAQPWLYPGLAVLVAWALAVRMPRARRLSGAVLFLAAALLGHGIHVGVFALQGQVEEWGSEYLQDLMAGKPDPFRERTRIGDLGRIKLSDRIVMRVTAEGPRPDALLLRESAFDRYRSGEWQAARRPPREVQRQGEAWQIAEGPAQSRIVVRRTLPGGEGLLPLPAGTRRIEHLPADRLEAYPSGAVLARGTPRYIAMRVLYDEGSEAQPPTASTDIEVPGLLAPMLEAVLVDERLRRPTARETLAAIQGLFEEKFSYSLALSGTGEGAQARTIGDFLLRERKGHCEYFATATVLLLRQAGIAARYVGGYSAQEFSELEKAFVVRSRHAHAWASAYVDGRWVNVDTTPARWAEFEEREARNFIGPWLDRVSWLAESALRWWLALAPGAIAPTAALTIAAITALLMAAFLWRKRRQRSAASPGAPADAVGRAWQAIESKLARAGHRREPGETVRAWVARLRGDRPTEAWRATLEHLARDYYAARFDPASSETRIEEFLLAARHWKPGPVRGDDAVEAR